MSRVRRVTVRALNVLVWAVLIAAVAVLVVPRLMGWHLETVLTGSMQPTLPVGSIIAVQPVDQADIGVGDVITFKSGGTPPLTTHRVIEVRDDTTFVTKGDANEDVDVAPVDDGTVLGQARFYIPFAGYAAVALKQPMGWGMVAAGLVLLWSQSELFSKDSPRDGKDPEAETELVEQVAA